MQSYMQSAEAGGEWITGSDYPQILRTNNATLGELQHELAASFLSFRTNSRKSAVNYGMPHCLTREAIGDRWF